MENFVIISGCSSGGKSTLLRERQQRGFGTIDEPGRRIAAEELIRNGKALPWMDAVAFARRAIEVSLADRGAADACARWVFFDRGLIDAAAALEHLTREPILRSLGLIHRTIEMCSSRRLDRERRLGLAEAIAEYAHLLDVYPPLGYDIQILPKVSVAERADWILTSLAR